LTIVVLTNATQASPEKVALGVAALYIPDKHLSNAGNILLMSEIYAHLRGYHLAASSAKEVP
jgi:hypothetical protein